MLDAREEITGVDKETGNLQFGLLKMLLWTAVLALLLGILKTLQFGFPETLHGLWIVFSVCICCWLFVVGVVRVVIAPKTAAMLSVAIATVAAISFFLLLFGDGGGPVLAVLVGFPSGLFLGLIVAVIVELAISGVNWADEFIQSLERDRKRRCRLVLWGLLLSPMAVLFLGWQWSWRVTVAENVRRESKALANLDQYGAYTDRSWVSGEITALRFRSLDDAEEDWPDSALANLHELRKLKTLNLAGTGVTDSCLKHLERLTGLQELGLGGTQVSDAGLEHLKRLVELRVLRLAGTQVGDAGIEHLEGLRSIEHLCLFSTEVTDAGLEHLRGLTALREVSLSDTQITNKGLDHLKRLTDLRVLGLCDTPVTRAGIEKLQESLPECGVIWYGPYPESH